MYYLGHLQKTNLKWQDSFRIALLVAISVFIYQCFQLPQGDWILYTITFIYMGGVINGLALQRAIKRFYGAPLGFYAGFLFMGLLTYFDYRFNYLLPVFAVVAFWYLFMTGEYGVFVLFFMVFFMLFYDLTSSEYNDLNIVNLIFSRIYATLIGGLLIILGELFIFPKSSNAVSDTRCMAEKIISHLVMAVDTIAEHSRKNLKLKHGYWNELSFLNMEITHFAQALASYRQEAETEEKTADAMNHVHEGLIMIYDGVRILELACYYNDDGVQKIKNQDALTEVVSYLQDFSSNQLPVQYEDALLQSGMNEEYGLALKKIYDGVSLVKENLKMLN